MKKEPKSIVTDDLEHCYIHRKYLGIEVAADHIHHLCHGTANRKIADREGLICGLCEYCHRMLHDKGYHDMELLQEAERTWLSFNNSSIEEWIKLMGRNYL